MRRNVMNPHFYDQGVVNLTVEAKENATTGAYEGLTWDLQQDAQPLNEVPANGTAQSVFPTSRFTYAGGVMTRVNATAPETNGSAPRGCCAVFTDNPCLLSGDETYPSVNFDISNAVGVGKGTWAIGLTRYNLDNPLIDPTTGDIKCFAPPYFASNFDGGLGALGNAFFDYVAVRMPNGDLKLFQSCVQGNRVSGDNLTMKEVVYYHSGNGAFKSGIYNLETNVNAYTHLRFSIENQGIVCDIGDHGQGSFDVLVNTTLGDKKKSIHSPFMSSKLPLSTNFHSNC